jgi:hypothetical protein
MDEQEPALPVVAPAFDAEAALTSLHRRPLAHVRDDQPARLLAGETARAE